MERRNSRGNGVGWFLAGGIAGACAALLLAPATGKRTRDRITRRLRNTKESVTDMADDLADTTRHIVDKVRHMSDDAVRMAREASTAARDAAGSLGVKAFARH